MASSTFYRVSLFLSSLVWNFIFIIFICSAEEADPYLWLENPNDQAVQEWISKQTARFEEYHSSNPYVEDIKEELWKLKNRIFYGNFIRSGDNYLFTQLRPGDDQYVLCMQKGLEGKQDLLIDPNQWENSPSALVDFSPSPDGNYLAYSYAENGSDWMTWKIMHSDTRELLTEAIEKIKFSSISWSADSRGFYYSRFDEDDLHGVYYHLLGTPQTEDQLIYRKGENYFYVPSVSSDGEFLLIQIFTGSSSPNSYLCMNLASADEPPFELIPLDGFSYSFVWNKGSKFYFRTNKDAPRGKLIRIDLKEPGSPVITDSIAEREQILENVVPLGEFFLASYLKDVSAQLLFLIPMEIRSERFPYPVMELYVYMADALISKRKIRPHFCLHQFHSTKDDLSLCF